MYTHAPPEAKRPVGEPKPAVGARPPVELEPPLWPIAHERSADAVLGLALNYRLQDHRRFVGTLRKAGFAGDVVIATQPLKKMKPDAIEFLRGMRVIAYPINPVCNTSGSTIKHKTCHWHSKEPPLPLAIIRHQLYRAWAEHYSEDSLFYVADYRDTFFQASPFPPLRAERASAEAPPELVLFAEHYPFKKLGNCPFNGGWVRGCWGKKVYDRMKAQVVLCSGSYMGTKRAIIAFESTLLDEVQRAQCHAKGQPSDQGYLNKLYYAGQLSEAVTIAVHDRGTGIVNTVGSLDGSRPRGEGYLPPTHVNLGEYWGMRNPSGYVMQDDGVTYSPAVHQWDRFYHELRDHVDKTLACDGCFDYSPPSRSQAAAAG